MAMKFYVESQNQLVDINETHLVTKEFTTSINGDLITIANAQFRVWNPTGEMVFDRRLKQQLSRNLIQAYSQKHALISYQQVIQYRKQHRLSIEKFAQKMKIDPVSLADLEIGNLIDLPTNYQIKTYIESH